jgi:hypothetical protein
VGIEGQIILMTPCPFGDTAGTRNWIISMITLAKEYGILL